MTTVALSFYGTSIGKKVVMAVTGVILFGFVVGHMLGNLQLYLGPDRLNAYAAFLKGTPALLWTVRGVLLISVALHILSATQLTLQSWRARPKGYARQRYQESDYAARTMRWSGPILALFLIYHLAHLTLGSAGPRFSPTDVYGNVVAGFRVWWISAFYIAAMLALGLHMFHGVWSLMQTLGANHPRYNHWRRIFAVGITLVVVFGNISMPVSVLTGLVR
jgi:succinate dehydrogenase / fumarate reductase cytochrome b subunit